MHGVPMNEVRVLTVMAALVDDDLRRLLFVAFLQGVSIACYAEGCISYDSNCCTTKSYNIRIPTVLNGIVVGVHAINLLF